MTNVLQSYYNKTMIKIKCFRKQGFWTVDNGHQMWDFLTVTKALQKVAELRGVTYE